MCGKAIVPYTINFIYVICIVGLLYTISDIYTMCTVYIQYILHILLIYHIIYRIYSSRWSHPTFLVPKFIICFTMFFKYSHNSDSRPATKGHRLLIILTPPI